MFRAPEQADAEFGDKGTHTDVWGFASSMLHLATGQLPYAGLTQVQMLTAMVKQRPPAVPDTLPAWLGQSSANAWLLKLLSVLLCHNCYR